MEVGLCLVLGPAALGTRREAWVSVPTSDLAGLGQGRAELEEESCRLPGGRAVCVCVSLPAAVLLPQQPFPPPSTSFLFLLLLIPHCRLLFFNET